MVHKLICKKNKMARIATDGGFADQGGAIFGLWTLLFIMIFVSLSIISMVIFACSDDNSNKPRRKRHGGGGAGRWKLWRLRRCYRWDHDLYCIAWPAILQVCIAHVLPLRRLKLHV